MYEKLPSELIGMLPEINSVMWGCDRAYVLLLFLVEVCVCVCVPVWAAADRSWGTETDKAAGGLCRHNLYFKQEKLL